MCVLCVWPMIIHLASGCEVVAIGTGNYNTKESASPNGRVLHDSHAVVTARRSLMRYVYLHLCIHECEKTSLQNTLFSLYPGSKDGSEKV